MLDKYLKLTEPRLSLKLKQFSTALAKGRFSVRRNISLVFLCGANKEGINPSERRNYLKKTIQKHLPHARIVYAEAVMDELTKHGKTKNLLDIEQQISLIADWIIIVLESYSSFCELGAFANEVLREKLIVINDKNYQAEKSFINLGPIQAITETGLEGRVHWYPMGLDGIRVLDTIGSTVPGILRTLQHQKSRPKIEKSDCVPDRMTQKALFFLHDIIYLCGPISHQETVEIYKFIFGEKLSYDGIKSLRGILIASDLINTVFRNEEHCYTSTSKETFINFHSSSHELTSAFRRFQIKHYPERLSLV